jgi:elongation factor Ts
VTSASDVKALRERTGAGFLECKKALEHAAGDLEKAISFLREKGLASALKKAGRVANDGRVHSYIHGNGKIGVLVEINCETDFVARTDDFIQLSNDIALHIAATNPRYLTKDAVPAEEIEKEKEIFRAQAEGSGKPAAVIEKIIDGKIAKYFEEVCLLHQAYVKEPSKNIETVVKEAIAKLGENISIRRFARFQLGEGAKA